MDDSKYNQFITANTIALDIDTIREEHVVPVHVKDNEQTISHTEFIESTCAIAREVFGECTDPVIRVSHPIKGRVPEARNKPASELLPEETTLYYERMAWMVNFPGISAKVGDEVLDLAIGGVKAFNLDNLNTTKDSFEHFKLFVGFKNQVCTNLCISTTGFQDAVKVQSIDHLKVTAKDLFRQFHSEGGRNTINEFNQLRQRHLTEKQFAQVLGRVKLFNAMNKTQRSGIPEIGLTDNQLNTVAVDYFNDKSHARNDNGDISLWNVYNLFTGANKSSYIDKFLHRNILAFEGVNHLSKAVTDGDSWYLN